MPPEQRLRRDDEGGPGRAGEDPARGGKKLLSLLANDTDQRFTALVNPSVTEDGSAGDDAPVYTDGNLLLELSNADEGDIVRVRFLLEQ